MPAGELPVGSGFTEEEQGDATLMSALHCPLLAGEDANVDGDCEELNSVRDDPC